MTLSAEEYRLPDGLAGTILERIMTARVPDIIRAKGKCGLEALRARSEAAPSPRSMKDSLSRKAGIIAEIKKASPSAGLIRRDFNPHDLVQAYQAGGAAAVSVVTEPEFFQGRLEVLAGIREVTGLPLLRKDFIVDPYQIHEARVAGADAVLLITGLLDERSLSELLGCAESVGMDALVEVHTEMELETALDAGASLIGINCRDLKSFHVSLDTGLRLASGIPKDAIAVAESGIRSAGDLALLAAAGYRGFLIGEILMRAPDPESVLKELLSALTMPPDE